MSSEKVKKENFSSKTEIKIPSNDDCFQRFGLILSNNDQNRRLKRTISKSEEHKNQVSSSDQPVHLVEEIDAITALILYNTYSKQHESTLSPQHRGKRPTISEPLQDEIDRFNALYSCLFEQTSNKHQLNELLRNRFYSLSDVEKLKKFEEKEYPKIVEEKRKKRQRISFIPNILSFQRTCLDDELNDLKWIRENLC